MSRPKRPVKPTARRTSRPATLTESICVSTPESPTLRPRVEVPYPQALRDLVREELSSIMGTDLTHDKVPSTLRNMGANQNHAAPYGQAATPVSPPPVPQPFEWYVNKRKHLEHLATEVRVAHDNWRAASFELQSANPMSQEWHKLLGRAEDTAGEYLRLAEYYSRVLRDEA